MNDDQIIGIAAPPAPAIDATITLINTATMFANGKKSISLHGLSRALVTFNGLSHASAATGLRQYASSDGGVTWYEVEAGETVGVVSAGAVDPHDYPIDFFDDWKLEYTNGAAVPTTWSVSLKLLSSRGTAT